MKLGLLRWFNRHGLSRRKLKTSLVYRVFGERLMSKSLWRFEKGGVIRGWVVGCFGACNPFLGAQIMLTTPFILLFRANVFVTIAVIFFTNPFTIGPFLYGAYRIGAWVLQLRLQPIPEDKLEDELAHVPEQISAIDWGELFSNPSEKFIAVMLGCFIIAVVSSVVGAALIALLWRPKTPKTISANRTP